MRRTGSLVSLLDLSTGKAIDRLGLSMGTCGSDAGTSESDHQRFLVIYFILFWISGMLFNDFLLYKLANRHRENTNVRSPISKTYMISSIRLRKSNL